MNKENEYILNRWGKITIIKAFEIAFFCGILLETIMITIDFLFVLFSSSEEGKRDIFFKAIIFDSFTTPDGTLEMTIGLGENSLIILWIGLFLVVFITLFILSTKYLVLYRKKLIGDYKNESRIDKKNIGSK